MVRRRRDDALVVGVDRDAGPREREQVKVDYRVADRRHLVARGVMARHHAARDEVAAVGDTVIDLDLFALAGTSVAVNTDDERVIAAATHHLPGESLDGLLALLLPH